MHWESNKTSQNAHISDRDPNLVNWRTEIQSKLTKKYIRNREPNLVSWCTETQAKLAHVNQWDERQAHREPNPNMLKSCVSETNLLKPYGKHRDFVNVAVALYSYSSVPLIHGFPNSRALTNVAPNGQTAKRPRLKPNTCTIEIIWLHNMGDGL